MWNIRKLHPANDYNCDVMWSLYEITENYNKQETTIIFMQVIENCMIQETMIMWSLYEIE